MNKLYGNENAISTLTSMLDSGRVSHSYLFYGEKGLGKKTLAEWLAARIVGSENVTQNPDVIWAKHEGKLGGFKVEHVRSLIADAFILPNSADSKVYIFTDCDNMNASAQNALLKMIEEPPDFTYFIFTVSSKSSILPTILSRVISIGLSECTETQCREALAERGYDSRLVNDAVSAFHGNIGMCLEYIEGEALAENVKLIEKITNSIIDENEYELLKCLDNADKDRASVKNALSMLDKVIRDAAAMKFGAKPLGSCEDGASRLSSKATLRRLEAIHDIIRDTIRELDSNVSVSAELTSFCGQIFSV